MNPVKDFFHGVFGFIEMQNINLECGRTKKTHLSQQKRDLETTNIRPSCQTDFCSLLQTSMDN